MTRNWPQAVSRAVAAGHTVREVRTASRASLVLAPPGAPSGRGRPAGTIALMIAGRKTHAGEHYERETGQPLVRPADWLGAPFIVGNASWIRISGLGRRKLSSFVRGQERLTIWGKRWFREHPV